MGQSSFAGFLAVELEDDYGVDAIDLAQTPGFDLAFLRPYTFDVAPAAPTEQQDVVRPSFSRHPHVTIPTHVDISSWNMPLVASPEPGEAGGEAPLGITEAFQSAGFRVALDSPGDPVYIRPSTQPTKSFTAYRWQRQLKGATPLWRLWRLHGCRLSQLSFGGAVNAVATVETVGMSANFERDASETAKPWGVTKPLDWFDADGPKLDQYGDALAFTGSFEHAMYTPMVTTVARVSLNGVHLPLSTWRVICENTIDTMPHELADGTVIQEHVITDRTIRFEGTLKDTSDAYQQFIEAVRANLNGDPEEVILGLEIELNDGGGSGGTSWRIIGTVQPDTPSRSDENRLAAWSVVGFFTPHSTARAYSNVELTFASASDTVVRTSGSWIDDGVSVGELVTFAGTSDNNATFEIVDIVSGSTLLLGTTPTNETEVTANYVVSPTLLGDNELEIKIFETP